MTEGEAKIVLGEHLCDKCVNRKCETECDYAKAHDMTIKALDKMSKLRELPRIRIKRWVLYIRTLERKA